MKRKLVIGVLGDTHGNLPSKVVKSLKTCDFIIHLGDVELALKDGNWILNSFGSVPVHLVHGNSDKTYFAYIPKLLCFRIKKWKIYASHSFYIPHLPIYGVSASESRFKEGRYSFKEVKQRLAYYFNDGNVFLFGHIHKRLKLKENNILYLSPGALGGTLSESPSFMKLFVSSTKLTPVFYGVDGEEIN